MSARTDNLRAVARWSVAVVGRADSAICNCSSQITMCVLVMLCNQERYCSSNRISSLRPLASQRAPKRSHRLQQPVPACDLPLVLAHQPHDRKPSILARTLVRAMGIEPDDQLERLVACPCRLAEDRAGRRHGEAAACFYGVRG